MKIQINPLSTNKDHLVAVDLGRNSNYRYCLFLFIKNTLSKICSNFSARCIYLISSEDSLNTSSRGMNLSIKTRISGLLKFFFWFVSSIIISLLIGRL